MKFFCCPQIEFHYMIAFAFIIYIIAMWNIILHCIETLVVAMVFKWSFKVIDCCFDCISKCLFQAGNRRGPFEGVGERERERVGAPADCQATAHPAAAEVRWAAAEGEGAHSASQGIAEQKWWVCEAYRMILTLYGPNSFYHRFSGHSLR